MIFRNILLTILALAVLPFCAFVAMEVIRIEAAVRGTANSLTATAAKIDGVVDHVDRAVEQAPAALEKAVGNAINPLPASPFVSVPSHFKQSTPTPAPKRP